MGPRVAAQPVIATGSPPPPEIVPAAVARPPALSPNLAAPPDPPPDTPFAWGQLTLHPHFAFAYVHGDGINVQPGVPVTTALERYSAGATLVMGPHWVADYSADRSFYSNPAFRDTFDQAFSLAGGNVYRDWTLKVLHSSEAKEVPLVETGRQTQVHQHHTILSAVNALSSDFRLELTGAQFLRTAEGAPSSRDWSGAGWLDYRLAPTVDFGAGLTAGFVDVRPGANLYYRTPQLRLAWRPRDNLQVRLTGGEEYCTFYSHVESQLQRPTYSGSIEYRPTRTTSLRLHHERVVSIATDSSQVSENTREGIALQQRLLGHFFLSAGVERQKLHYLNPLLVLAGPGARNDTRQTMSVRLSTTFRQRGTLSLVQERTRNASNLAGYDFTTNQTAFEVAYRF
jgi:hypothetical protein